MNTNFSIFSSETPTNKDIVVTFTPPKNITKYTYRVYSDGELINANKIESNESHNITLDTTGKFQIKVEAYDKFGKEYDYISGYYVIDKEAPTLTVGASTLTLNVGDSLNVMANVKANDNYDGNITSRVTTNISSLDLSQVGTEKLIYTVSDSSGNAISKTVEINIIKQNTTNLFIIQIIILISLLILMQAIIRYRNSMNLERRFGKYSVKPRVDKTPSLFDKVIAFYDNLVITFSTVIRKSEFLVKYSKRFDKYLLFTKDRYKTGLDIVSSKILIAIIFLLIAVVSKALQYKTLAMYEIIFPLVIGFFVLDVIYAIEYKIYRDKVENDLLQAIIIMNNAFKSGRSITQAITLVGNELTGVIGEQFKIMSKELSKGLSIDVVFKRFADRIDIDEVNYLTASLTILNKTGGNIIKVFSSIENSLFMKKKLRLELQSLTGSSKIIMWVLFCVPVAFVIIISLLSPGYFDPFFNNPVGIGLFVMMVIYYIIYILAVRKILKVRM